MHASGDPHLGSIAHLREIWQQPSPSQQDSITLLTVVPGACLVSAIDALVAGIHYPVETAPADIGYKALAVNLSDLAAMGADPLALSISLVQPQPDPAWAMACFEGMHEIGREFDLALGGICLAQGPSAVTVQIFGQVPSDLALKRSGASAGDEIFVTGTLGDAGLALAAHNGQVSLSPNQYDRLRTRLDRPTPRVRCGVRLRGIASAAIDVSDGLAQDLGHILCASAVGANINTAHLAFSPTLLDALDNDERIRFALFSGDDYELCFTVPGARLTALREMEAELGCAITSIGTIRATSGLQLLRADGSELAHASGFAHFS